MSVEQEDVIDYISIDRATGDVLLTIADHLPWDDFAQHLTKLEAKVNSYLRFVTSGQLIEARPEAAGRHVIIDLVVKHFPPAEARHLLEAAKSDLIPAAVGFSYRLIAPKS